MTPEPAIQPPFDSPFDDPHCAKCGAPTVRLLPSTDGRGFHILICDDCQDEVERG